jgi:2,4-dienoyl-CoA reductase-like NADH-dependent reductase (Old Yellow Enzyme family)
MHDVRKSDLTAKGMETLFSPLRVAGMVVPNRIVMAPMTRSRSPGGIHGPKAAAYYRRRAENGVGLIITEGTWIPHAGAADEDNVPFFYGEEALGEWGKILADVHAVGGRIMPQLWHVGLTIKPQGHLEERYCGPSGMAGGFGMLPEKLANPMIQSDIDAVIDAYAKAAATAYSMGFDGVELHGAHGYLIDQFLWDKTNLRQDRYGGSIERRSQFAAEIVAEIRKRTSRDFPISLRFSQWKGHDFNAKLVRTPQELERMLAPIVNAGVDMFDCSQRRFWEPEFTGSEMNLAGWTRKVTGIPAMTVGSVSLDNELIATQMGESAGVTRIDALLEMLGRGDFALVGVGRALIANPDWPRLVRQEAWDRLRPYSKALLQELS